MKLGSSLLWLLPVLATAQSTGPDTEDGTCAGPEGLMCTPTWGSCCGSDNICGRSDLYCGTGCQGDFGNCNVVIPPKPTPTPGSISPDGSCGGTNQFKCAGSSFGECCSGSGWCGKDPAFCESGCQPGFGTCTAGSGNITSDGQCGANGKTCVGASFGDCCSGSGWCGIKEEHCGAGCQGPFGICPSVTSAVPSATPTSNISTNGQCGANGGGKTCKGSIYGDCCSAQGWCGVSEGHCAASDCQVAFGTCITASSTTAAVPTPTSNISVNGQCGSTGGGKTCKGSTYGDCCSSNGWCGKTSDHCLAVNCNKQFGSCDAPLPTTTTVATTTTKPTAPTPTSNISTNGSCGGAEKKTCVGSTFGTCCSSSGFCGSESAFCGAGCQTAFGSGCSAATNISTDGSCSTNKKTCKGSTYGDCCSVANYCGSSTSHCTTGCQAGFGTCSVAGTISTDGSCGSRNGKSCVGSTYGSCCSKDGYCGSSTNFCGQGCQKGSSSGCLLTNIPSQDGSCGSKVSLTCAGGSFNGNCCSSSGFCGTGASFCRTGCQKNFGKCT